MILGLDLSLNHGGAVALSEDGELERYWFVTERKGAADRGKEHGVRSPVRAKDTDAEQHQLDRMNFYVRWIWQVALMGDIEYAGIEGYAYAAQTNSGYQYGELGGHARRTLARAGVMIRIHDPQSVKMFATGNGNADVTDLLAAVPADLREEWIDMDRGLKGTPVAEDLAVAYWIARLVWSEVELRAGRIQLSDFDKKRVRVFTRITKAYPVNLLDREWLKR